MYQSDSAPWLEFYAWNTDGSAKTDLVYNTSGISIVVVRDNLANSSVLTLSAASGPTDWAAGKFHAMGGNKYRVGIATASISSFTGQISVEGSYTGGVLTGVTREVSAYNPAGNPNTTTPPTAAANASAVRAELATELARVDAAISTRSTFAGGAVASVTGNVGGNVVGSVASVVGAVVLDPAALDPVLEAIAALEAGALSEEQAALLIAIGQRTALITGSRLSVAGSVTPGGTIQLIVGKDYVTAAENGLTRTITDPDGNLYDQLTSSTLAATKRFGASRPNGIAQITGTIGDVTHADGVTSITIEIERSGLPDDLQATADYRYQIERETGAGKKVIAVSGDLILERRTV